MQFSQLAAARLPLRMSKVKTLQLLIQIIMKRLILMVKSRRPVAAIIMVEITMAMVQLNQPENPSIAMA